MISALNLGVNILCAALLMAILRKLGKLAPKAANEPAESDGDKNAKAGEEALALLLNYSRGDALKSAMREGWKDGA